MSLLQPSLSSPGLQPHPFHALTAANSSSKPLPPLLVTLSAACSAVPKPFCGTLLCSRASLQGPNQAQSPVLLGEAPTGPNPLVLTAHLPHRPSPSLGPGTFPQHCRAQKAVRGPENPAPKGMQSEGVSKAQGTRESGLFTPCSTRQELNVGQVAMSVPPVQNSLFRPASPGEPGIHHAPVQASDPFAPISRPQQRPCTPIFLPLPKHNLALLRPSGGLP